MFWRTTFSFYNTDIELREKTSANHMYVRYFDVDWSALSEEGKPIGTLAIYSGMGSQTSIITPSIFFTNKVFINSSKAQLDTLSLRIKDRILQVDEKFKEKAESESRYDTTIFRT